MLSFLSFLHFLCVSLFLFFRLCLFSGLLHTFFACFLDCYLPFLSVYWFAILIFICLSLSFLLYLSSGLLPSFLLSCLSIFWGVCYLSFTSMVELYFHYFHAPNAFMAECIIFNTGKNLPFFTFLLCLFLSFPPLHLFIFLSFLLGLLFLPFILCLSLYFFFPFTFAHSFFSLLPSFFGSFV